MSKGNLSSSAGETVGWHVADGMVYLDHPRFKKSPMKLLPGRSHEANAEWLLRELEREIKLGIARAK